MEESNRWKTVIDLDGWVLTILLPHDYALITDFELVAPSGERYLGSAGTPEMVRQLLDGDDPWNDPFWMSDLVMVRELSEASIVSAVRTLISRDEVRRALDRAEDTGESDELDTA